MATRLRLAFMGTPAFSVRALAALVDAGHEIGAVYTQPPRPAGRGHQIQISAVHQWADAHDLMVRHPKTLRTAEAQAEFAALDLDAAIVVAYGLILPAPILAAPRLGCLNIHASILPRWRGAAPIHRALLAGDQETGITIMQMDEGLDTGPMLAIGKTPITPDDTAQSLHDRLSDIGASLVVRTLASHATNSLIPVPQPEDGITYAHKLSRADSPLDWHKPAYELARQIRALTPWPGCFFTFGDEAVKVLDVGIMDHGSDKNPGTLLDRDGVVACGDGTSLILKRIQRPNRPPMSGRDWINGCRLEPGICLIQN